MKLKGAQFPHVEDFPKDLNLFLTISAKQSRLFVEEVISYLLQFKKN